MRLVPLDWLIVVASIVVSFIPAVVLARRAGSSTAEFFTSGRSAPWWLVGVLWTHVAIVLTLMLLSLHHLRRIFQRVRDGAPFDADNALRMRSFKSDA